MPLRASSHPGSPNSPSCSALAWYSCWPGLSPWGESWKRTRVARTAALTRYRYATQQQAQSLLYGMVSPYRFVDVCIACLKYQNLSAYIECMPSEKIPTHGMRERFWHSGVSRILHHKQCKHWSFPQYSIDGMMITEWRNFHHTKAVKTSTKLV